MTAATGQISYIGVEILRSPKGYVVSHGVTERTRL